jgi:hypothetical protein
VRAVLALIVLSGCHLSADYGGTSYKCAGASDCPGGQTCSQAGMCVVPGAVDAAPVIDAAWPDNLMPNPDMELGLDGTWDAYNGVLRTSNTDPHGGTTAIVACKTADMTNSYFSAYADALDMLTPGAIPQGALFRMRLWIRASHMATELPPPRIHLVIREAGGATAQTDHMGAFTMPVDTTWVMLAAEAMIDQPDRTRVTMIVTPEDDVPDTTCFAIDDAYAGQF